MENKMLFVHPMLLSGPAYTGTQEASTVPERRPFSVIVFLLLALSVARQRILVVVEAGSVTAATAGAADDQQEREQEGKRQRQQDRVTDLVKQPRS